VRSDHLHAFLIQFHNKFNCLCRIEGLDTDTSGLTERYRGLESEAQNIEILKDFERRWKNGREKLTQKLTRGNV
jgi:hypothetical protein